MLAGLTPALHAQVLSVETRNGFHDVTTLAKAGDAEAQYQLGLAYRDGQDVTQDAVQALRWFRQAADKGHPGAEYEVGQLEEDGEGTDKNLTDAADWYRKAADQGQLQAIFALGELYRTGQGGCREGARVCSGRALRRTMSIANWHWGKCARTATAYPKTRMKRVCGSVRPRNQAVPKDVICWRFFCWAAIRPSLFSIARRGPRLKRWIGSNKRRTRRMRPPSSRWVWRTFEASSRRSIWGPPSPC